MKEEKFSMNYEELLEFLGIENGTEFEYFENLADLIEADDEISDEALYQIFKEADKSSLADLLENYFEDILKSIPDDSTDIFTLIEGVKMSFIGLVEAIDSGNEEETSLVHFCDELNNFKNWYSRDSKAECIKMSDGSREVLPVRDALVYSRLEKLDGDKYQYDFQECMDYSPEEYVLTYGDLARAMRDDQQEQSGEYIDDYAEFDPAEEY